MRFTRFAIHLVSAVILMAALWAVNIVAVSAQQGGGDNGRYMTVTNTYTQYSWQLISRSAGRVLCLVNVNHEGYPTYSEAMAVCQYALYPLPTPTTPSTTPTPTYAPIIPPAPGSPEDTPTPDAMDNTYWRYLSQRVITQTQKIPIPPIVINLLGNTAPTLKPYVTVTAYEPFSDYKITSVRGDVGGIPFVCEASSCDLVVGGDVTINYWATSNFGDESPHYSATIRITEEVDGYKATVTASGNISVYHDSCAGIWGNAPSFQNSNWSNFPQTPQELATAHRLYYLGGELLRNNLVDASECAGKGLFADGSPNACGMDKAMPKIVEWQNHYDPAIWSASRDIGIPPALLKSIIEQESQFWPASTRFMFYEYGLGQINEQGADVALRWDNNLYNLVCNNMMMDCKSQYAYMTPASQALLRGGLVSWLDADCPACEHGISPQRAEQSMRIIAQILRANCYQTSYLYQKYTTGSNYEDSWRFAMVSYHGGYQCLADAMLSTLTQREPMDWNHLSTHLETCPDVRDYVDNLWARVTAFQPNASAVMQARPVVEITTPTPVPAPTTPPNPLARNGRVHVIVFMDYNNDNVLGNGELVDNINVTVKYEDGSSESQKTANGEATFNFQNELKGSRVMIVLPEVYRTLDVTIPDDGNIFVLVRLAPPSLPSKLP